MNFRLRSLDPKVSYRKPSDKYQIFRSTCPISPLS